MTPSVPFAERWKIEMKVFVTGVAGQLGHDVMNELHTILQS